MNERVALGLLVGGFAAFATAHVFCLLGLALRKPRARALGALLVPPLAPFWAHAAGLRWRAWLWGGFAVVYGIGLFLLRR